MSGRLEPAGTPGAEWTRATLEETGLRPGLGEGLDRAVSDGRLDRLHGVVIVKDGRLVLERYYVDRDWRWGENLGTVAFGPETLHDLRSVTKSLVSLLYGIALGEGLVPPPEAVLVEQFPQYADLAADPERRRMTVGHALSMRLGLEWNEDLPYSDGRNHEIAMERAPDRYRFVLEQPFEAIPGTWWNYSGGATALIAHLIERGAGTTLPEFAQEKLFQPMGIESFDWIHGDDGVYSAASGARLTPRDLARVGQLVLNGGRWEDRQVVPEAWLEASFQPRSNLKNGLRYGYQWWLAPKDGSDWVAGFGNGGQRLFVLPSAHLVVAVTAGKYNQPDAWEIPVAVITEHVFPALRGD